MKSRIQIYWFFGRCHSKFCRRLKSWVHKSNDFIHSATLPSWYPNNIKPEQKYKTDLFLVHVIFSEPTNSQREEEGGLEDEFRLRKSWTKRPMARERDRRHLCERANERTAFVSLSLSLSDSCIWSCELSKVNHLRQRKWEGRRERERAQSPSNVFMNCTNALPYLSKTRLFMLFPFIYFITEVIIGGDIIMKWCFFLRQLK